MDSQASSSIHPNEDRPETGRGFFEVWRYKSPLDAPQEIFCSLIQTLFIKLRDTIRKIFGNMKQYFSFRGMRAALFSIIIKLYYTVPNARLNSLKKSIIYQGQGPLAYNYFCNKIQNSLNTQDRKYKYEIHKLTPKCFSIPHKTTNTFRTSIRSSKYMGIPQHSYVLNPYQYCHSKDPVSTSGLC